MRLGLVTCSITSISPGFPQEFPRISGLSQDFLMNFRMMSQDPLNIPGKYAQAVADGEIHSLKEVTPPRWNQMKAWRREMD